jgi:hypothetical protein
MIHVTLLEAGMTCFSVSSLGSPGLSAASQPSRMQYKGYPVDKPYVLTTRSPLSTEMSRTVCNLRTCSDGI